MLDIETSKSNSEVSKSNVLVEYYFFFENDVYSEGAVSHNVFFYLLVYNPVS